MSAIVDEASADLTRVSQVFWYLLRHPLDAVVLRWNWKAAFLSAILRSPIFFTAYYFQKRGLLIAIGAMLAQFVSRAIFGGVNGAIIQAFRKVEPAWHAVLTIPLILAAFSHVIEYIVQSVYDSAAGTHGKGKAILVSVFISVVSAIFNLFAMRRGALLVKDESQQPLWRDLIRMPWIALEFISFPLVWTVKKQRARSRRSKEPNDQDSQDF